MLLKILILPDKPPDFQDEVFSLGFPPLTVVFSMVKKIAEAPLLSFLLILSHPSNHLLGRKLRLYVEMGQNHIGAQ